MQCNAMSPFLVTKRRTGQSALVFMLTNISSPTALYYELSMFLPPNLWKLIRHIISHVLRLSFSFLPPPR